MFEQSVLTERRRPWTMAVSVTLQSAFVGAMLLLSVLSIERLPDVVLPTPLPPMPSAPKPVQVVATEIIRTATNTASALRVFSPTTIPKIVAMIEDPPAVTGGGYVPGGIVGTGMPAGMYPSTTSIIGHSDIAPPPPPQPVQEKAAPPQPPKVVNIGGNVLEGKLITRIIPEYPRIAVQARIQGVVRLMGVVGRDGRVKELRAIDGPPLLIPSAMAAVRQWIYSPTLLNGEPVEVMAPIEVRFTLGR